MDSQENYDVVSLKNTLFFILSGIRDPLNPLDRAT